MIIRTTAFVLTVAAASAATANASDAQDWRRPGAAPYDPIAATADQHRYEMDRLRAQRDDNDALARRQRLEAQEAVQALRAARRPTAVEPAPPIVGTTDTPVSPPDARLRGVGEIDAWLDRSRPRP